MITINIAKDYTISPGGRHKTDGDFSGEEFREKYLEPFFDDKTNNDRITVILDGTYGYGTSFLEEAFGGLARKFSRKEVLERIIFISDEEPLLINEIKKYIQESK